MRSRSPVSLWFGVSLCIAGAISLLARLRSPTLLGYYDDDAFYYFQIARNIVSLHRSTFDGTHLTNGYHPLWMLTLVGLGMLFSGKAFFVMLQCLALASFTTSFLVARSALRCISNNLAFTEIAASIVALQCLLLVRGGMEITITIPLTLLLCWYRLGPWFRWTPMVAGCYGLLSALIILSRLDSVVFIVMLWLQCPIFCTGWIVSVAQLLVC